MIDNSKEYILCAAYKRLLPSVPLRKMINAKDPSKQAQYGNIDDIYVIELGRRHNDILARFKGELIDDVGGFYTSHGRYVDRQEACKIALAAGQVVQEKLTQGSTSVTLFSEDLY